VESVDGIGVILGGFMSHFTALATFSSTRSTVTRCMPSR
jgi:hypothetical protein